MNKPIFQEDSMENIISCNNIEIWTKTFGENTGIPIIFIAGAMAPATFWTTEFCDKLVLEGYYVIMFDNRDFGYSTHFEEVTPPPYSIYDMVDDVKEVLKYYNVEKAHIVGHSLGGSIAQLFAIKYPEKTLSLIPISSPIIAKGDIEFVKTSPKILEEMWKVLMDNAMYQDFERGKFEFLKVHQYLNGDYKVDEGMSFEYSKRLYETEVIKPHLNHMNIQSNIEDIYSKLESLNKPIFFLYGDKDYLASSITNTILLHKSLSSSNLEILEGAGHMFFDKKIWDKLFVLINSFIKSKR